MKRFSAAVIGLGRIGQGYDYGLDPNRFILTHASAFATHSGFELVAGVDTDERERARFEKSFRRPAYSDIRSMLRQHRVEVASIGTPTAAHFSVFNEIIQSNPQAVVCEKPLAGSAAEADQMINIAQRSGCALLVNYMRRFEPGVLALKSQIQSQEFGEIYKGVVWYSKGLRNNGSHYVDLLRFALGECRAIEVIAKGRNWDGHDPEPDVRLRFGSTDVDFLALREECFSVADMDLVGTGGRIYYYDSGATIYTRKPELDPVFPGYTTLSPHTQTIPNDINRYQWHTCDHLYRHLTQSEPLNSSGQTALETLRIVENIISEL